MAGVPIRTGSAPGTSGRLHLRNSIGFLVMGLVNNLFYCVVMSAEGISNQYLNSEVSPLRQMNASSRDQNEFGVSLSILSFQP